MNDYSRLNVWAVVATVAVPLVCVTALHSKGVKAQEVTDSTEENTAQGFTRMAIPDDVEASFRCVSSEGAVVLEIADVKSFAPDKILDIMTFSVSSREGRTSFIYLGNSTDCVLELSR